MRIFILALTHAHAQHLAHAAGLRATDWIFLRDPYQLMGWERPKIVRADGAERRINYHQIVEQADSRSAIWFTEFDLQRGRIR